MKKLTVLLMASVALLFTQSAYAEPLQLQVSMGIETVTPSLNTNGEATTVTIKIPIQIRTFLSYGELGNTAQFTSVAGGGNGIAFILKNSTSGVVDDTSSIVSMAFTSNDAPISSNGRFVLSEGTIRNFILTVVILKPSHPNSFYAVQLKQLRIFREIENSWINIDLLSQENFRTDFCFINGTAPTDIVKITSDDLLQVSSCPAGIRVYPEKDAVVEIFSITGEKILTTNLNGGEAQIFSFLPGVYIVKSSTEGFTITKKAMVN